MSTGYRIAPLGDRAIIIEWEQLIDPAVHARVMQAFHYLQSLQLPYILDLLPAYASLTVVYDAVLIRQQEHSSAHNKISVLLAQALEQDNRMPPAPPRLLEIPVCYHPSLAPDITAMAEQKGLTIADVIRLHTETVYTIYMLGFLPGFPYMGKVDDRLATPRLKQPRIQVPAGSVGIAGSQTGIYSMASPGGWNIIGQTPLRLFDAAQDDPCYCRPGDQVQFVEITLEAFERLNRG